MKKCLPLVLIVALCGCGDEERMASVKSLTVAPWKMVSIKAKGKATDEWQWLPVVVDGIAMTDHKACAPELRVITFKPNFNFVRKATEATCGGTNTVETGAWGLNGDEKKLVLSLDGKSTVFEMVVLSEQTLQLEYFESPFFVQVTYQH